ncbi:MAG TPA: hypothetical protein PKA60_01745 [Candidatus Paceibacterota bacterium]|nr:hypothetical protein [Candidatus Paceibacterota bacterium]
MILKFTPESQDYLEATNEYISIWNKEGDRIINEFKKVTGLDFIHKTINIVVYEGPSWSGKKDKPMKLRASYDSDTKIATLIHELGHKLLVQLKNRIDGIDEHMILNIFLYDIWINLYGEVFANKAVAIEKNRKGIYDYEKAWVWALSKSYNERQKILNQIKNLN